MLASRTKKVAVYGRRGHRVVAVSDNHLTLTRQEQKQEEKPYSWLPPKQPLPSGVEMQRKSARLSTACRNENEPGMTKVHKPSSDTPNRRVLGAVPLTRNSPIPIFHAGKQGASNAKHPYKRSGLRQASPVVDVEIMVIDDDGKVLSKERRVSTPRAVRTQDDEDDDLEIEVKRPTRRRRGPVYRVDSSDDERGNEDSVDEDYIPNSSTRRISMNVKPIMTYAKTSIRRKTNIGNTVPTQAAGVTARPTRTRTRANEAAHAAVISNSDSSSESDVSILEHTNPAPSKLAKQTPATAATTSAYLRSSVEVLLPRLSQINISCSTTSDTKQQALAIPSGGTGLGNSPAPFVRSEVSRPRTVQPNSSKVYFAETARPRPFGDKPIPVYDSDDFDGCDISLDDELAEALRNAELTIREEQKNSSATRGTAITEIGGTRKKPRQTIATLSVPIPKRPSIGGPLGSLLMECNQETLLDFDAFVTSFAIDCKQTGMTSAPAFCKIGEASYSEVFGVGEVVLKVIPLRDMDGGRNRKHAITVDAPFMSEINDVLKEIAVTRAMGAMCQGFTKLISSHVVRGRYPKTLLALWDRYNSQKGSEGIRPDSFTKDQLYTVIVLANGGPDLEAFTFPHAGMQWRQACSIFWQVAKSIAQAEALAHFEHRDLHWGQILVKCVGPKPDERLNRRKKRATLAVQELTGPERVALNFMDGLEHGVEATVIDLGLSRMECNIDRPESGRYWTSFDEEIFNGSGDYQYDVYRMMRHHNGNNWEAYRPLTNVMWLHYLVDKLLNHKGLRAPSGRAPLVDDSGSLTPAQQERRAHACLREVEALLSRAIAPEALAVKVKLAKKRKGEASIDGYAIKSATDTVGYARKQGWIG